MENATKALLIIGAVLIAIVLISMGVYIVSKGQNFVGSINMDEQEIMAFNGKFTSYEGKQRGSQVNALAQTVLANNQTAASNGETATKGIKVTGKINLKADGTDTTFTRLPAGTYYNVTFKYEKSLIHEINISE